METLENIARDWLDHLRIERGASPHTISNYRRDITRYLNDLAAQDITRWEQITSQVIHDHLARMASGELGTAHAPSSVARASASIRGFHRFALREGIAASDPTADIRTPKQGAHLPKALTIDEVTRLLEAARVGEDARSLRDSALLEMLYATGARVSEIVALSADDLDLDEELPVVRLFGKGRKERLVPVGRHAREAVEAYLVRARPLLASRGRGESALFLNQRGKPLSRQSAWEIIQRAAARANLEQQISPHTLRHSFATHLLEGGASVRDVQELLGHASVQTTQIYTKITITTLREMYRSAHPRAQLPAT